MTVEETSDREKYLRTAFNGDGVITVNSTSDVNLQQVIKEIIEYEGSTVDLSGVGSYKRTDRKFIRIVKSIPIGMQSRKQ